MLSSQNSQLAIGGSDRLRFAAGFFFLLTLTVAAFAAGRLHFGFDVPTPLRDTALIAFVLSGLLQTWAMLVNPFFSPVIRLQTERGHHVIAEGPYAAPWLSRNARGRPGQCDCTGIMDCLDRRRWIHSDHCEGSTNRT